MADLRIDEASEAALKARLASPEGRAAVDELARIIAEAFARSVPEGTDLGLDTPEGKAAFRDAWPDIVDGFLHGRRSQPAKQKGVRKAKKTAEVEPKS
jgi:hypothetical protein